MKIKGKIWFSIILDIFLMLWMFLAVGQMAALFYVIYKLYQHNISLSSDSFYPIKLTTDEYILKNSDIAITFISICFLIMLVIGSLTNILSVNGTPSYMLVTVLVAPIVEEIAFRHYLQNRLMVLFGEHNLIWIIMLSAVIFGMAHYSSQGIFGVIVNFLRGILLSVIYYRYSKNLTYPIAIHTLINASAWV